MKFAFTDEQRMLWDTSQAFLADTSSSRAVRMACASDRGFDDALWRRVCDDMYWQGILVPEENDGLGLGWVEMVIVLEAAGERLLTSPLFAVAQSAAALTQCPKTACRDALFGSILAGDIVALALSNPSSDWHCVDARVDTSEGVTHLSGEAGFVSCGYAAEHVLVAAQNADDTLSLWSINPSQEGVRIERTPTMDQTRPMAHLYMDAVTVSNEQCLLADANEWFNRTLALSRILTVADQVGIAQASLDVSVAYTKERSQFDRTIASFQAIKHKAADMMLKVESARSLLYYAACTVDAWSVGQVNDEALLEAAYMASACASDAAFFNAGSGIQMHGGVGITEEYDIQLYFKRARATESFLGRPSDMRESLASQLLDGAAP